MQQNLNMARMTRNIETIEGAKMDINERDVTSEAIANKKFMEVFNKLHLPLSHLPSVYKGYLIAQYLNTKEEK